MKIGSDLRDRKLLKSIGAGSLARVISISTSLVTVPITLNYLGTERFGMWMTVGALISLISFSDFGIGNGLMTSIAAAHGAGKRAKIRVLISSAYVSLSVVASIALLILLSLSTLVDWPRFFNVSSHQATLEAAPTVAVLLILFAMGIPFSLVQRVQMGLQQTYIANLWQCLSSICTLVAVLAATFYQVDLPALVAVVVGTPLAILMLNSLTYFMVGERDIRPTPRMFSRAESRNLFHTGIMFVVLQIVTSVTYMSDSIFIARILGPEAVSEYSVAQKLFSVLSILLSVALVPLWPAYAEAIASGDAAWIKKTLMRSTIASVAVAAFVAFFLVLSGPTLIRWWVGTSVVAPFQLLLAFGIWKTLEAGGASLAMFLNGAQFIRFQIIIAVSTALCAVSLKFLLVNKFGISGALWATSISYVVCVIVPVIILRKKLFISARVPVGSTFNSPVQ